MAHQLPYLDPGVSDKQLQCAIELAWRRLSDYLQFGNELTICPNTFLNEPMFGIEPGVLVAFLYELRVLESIGSDHNPRWRLVCATPTIRQIASARGTLKDRVITARLVDLERDNRRLKDTVAEQAKQLDKLTKRVGGAESLLTGVLDGSVGELVAATDAALESALRELPPTGD